MPKDIISECYLPDPLTPPSTGNKKADEAIAKLSAMEISAYSPVARPSGAEYDKLAKLAASAGATKLLPIIDEHALQIGNCVYDETRIKRLAPSKKKAYQKAYDAAIHARKGRLAFLGWLFETVMPEGRDRLLQIAKNAKLDAAIRAQALGALWGATDDKQQLLELAKLFDVRKWDGKDKELEPLYRTCLRAWLDADPGGAFDALHGLLAVANVKKDPGNARADAVISTVMHVDNADPRWPSVLAPLATTELDIVAYIALEKLPPDPEVLDTLLDAIGKPEKITYWNNTLVTILGRIATPKAVPYLAAALESSWMNYPAAFEGFANAKDPSAIPIIREWLADNSSPDREQEAASIITGLEKFGPAPEAAPKKAKKEPARERPTLVFKKAKAFPKQKLPPIAKQEAEYTKMFVKAGIPKATKILQRAVVLIPKRVDEKTLPLGVTKLGGHPDLPADAKWPRLGKQPLTFLAQLKLDELAPHLPKDSPLPKRGYLAFFVDNDPLAGSSYLENARVIFTKPGTKLVRHELPDDFVDRIYQACACTPVAKLSMPSPSNRHVTKALSKADVETYADDVFVDGAALPQVLGYRDHGYDAEEPATAELLLQLTGDNQSEMEFGDCDFLSFFIDGKKLAKGDFSKVWPHVGD